MGKILPILLIVLGVGGGGAAGLVLRPAPPAVEHDEDAMQDEHAEKEVAPEALPEGEAPAFVKLNNQFIVPVVGNDNVSALVVLSLTLETLSLIHI